MQQCCIAASVGGMLSHSGVALGLALSLVVSNIATPSARRQSAAFSLPCLGYYLWLRAVSLLRLRVRHSSFAPPLRSAARSSSPASLGNAPQQGRYGDVVICLLFRTTKYTKYAKSAMEFFSCILCVSWFAIKNSVHGNESLASEPSGSAIGGSAQRMRTGKRHR